MHASAALVRPAPMPNSSGPHAVQLSAEIAPLMLDQRPLGHASCTEGFGQKLPCAQGCGAVEVGGQYCPGTQGDMMLPLQLHPAGHGCAMPSSHQEPAGHALHSAAEASGRLAPNEPGAHAVQLGALLLEALQRPSGHRVCSSPLGLQW